jgi:hypothetical protein
VELCGRVGNPNCVIYLAKNIRHDHPAFRVGVHHPYPGPRPRDDDLVRHVRVGPHTVPHQTQPRDHPDVLWLQQLHHLHEADDGGRPALVSRHAHHAAVDFDVGAAGVVGHPLSDEEERLLDLGGVGRGVVQVDDASLVALHFGGRSVDGFEQRVLFGDLLAVFDHLDFDRAAGEEVADVLLDARGAHAFGVGVADVASGATPALEGDGEVDEVLGLVGVVGEDPQVLDGEFLGWVVFAHLDRLEIVPGYSWLPIPKIWKWSQSHPNTSYQIPNKNS